MHLSACARWQRIFRVVAVSGGVWHLPRQAAEGEDRAFVRDSMHSRAAGGDIGCALLRTAASRTSCALVDGMARAARAVACADQMLALFMHKKNNDASRNTCWRTPPLCSLKQAYRRPVRCCSALCWGGGVIDLGMRLHLRSASGASRSTRRRTAKQWPRAAYRV